MDTNKTIVGIVGVVVVALMVFFGINAQKLVSPSAPEANNPVPVVSGNPSTAPSVPPVQAPAPQVPETPATVTVTYTDSGFSPATVTTVKGGMVTFKNNSSRNFWPATDPHPAHTGDSEKGCKARACDSCTPVPPEGEWTFTFNVPGRWEYHNHLSASHEGTVIVK